MYHDDDGMPAGKVVPYQVQLDSGDLVYAPNDKDAIIRKEG